MHALVLAIAFVMVPKPVAGAEPLGEAAALVRRLAAQR